MKLIEALTIIQTSSQSGAPEFPVELICGFTPKPLETFLGAHLQQRMPSVKVRCGHGQFGDLAGNLERYLASANGPGLLVMEWPDLDPRLGWRQLGGWGRNRVADILGAAELQVQHLLAVISNAPPAFTLAVVAPSLPLSPVEPVPGYVSGHLELGLQRLMSWFLAEISHHDTVRVLNTSRLADRSPLRSRLDVRGAHQTGSPYTLPHADALAAVAAELLAPVSPLKGIITDLDNTLWRGILGDAGVDGIAWDLEHQAAQFGAYQQMLQSLSESGVLIAVASKNDPGLVEQAFRRNDLLLRPEQVFPIEAHWQPKSASVGRILNAWNIAPDSVLFIDDSPMELEEVKLAHPHVRTRQFVPDPNEVSALLFDLADCFGKTHASAEDAIRLQSLRSSAQVRDMSQSPDTAERLLSSANGVLTATTLRIPPIPRALELINKTNQFNLNGRRWTEPEWHGLLSDPNSRSWLFSYEDRFGALGQISVVAGQTSRSGNFQILTWVLSCRAFARRIEHAVLDAIFRWTEAECIEFDFLPTDRNGPLRVFLESVCGQEPTAPLSLSRDLFQSRTLPWFLTLK